MRPRSGSSPSGWSERRPPNVWVAAVSVAVAGTGNGAVVCNALLVQRGAPDELRGRAFTLLMSSNYVVLGIGMIAAGPLTDELGRTVWAIAGARPSRRSSGCSPAASR